MIVAITNLSRLAETAGTPAGVLAAGTDLVGGLFWAWLALSVLVLVAWAVVTRGGFHRLADRPPRTNYLQLPTVLFIIIVWLLLGMLAGSTVRQLGLVVTPAPGQDASNLPASVRTANAFWMQMAQLVVIGMTAALILLIASVAFADRLRGFGLRWRQAGRDALRGVAYIAVILPCVLAVAAVTAALFKRLGWEVVGHELLRTLDLDDTRSVISAIVLAVLAAPIGEELLFRGIVQSFLVRFFSVMMPPKGFPTMALWFHPPELAQAQAQAVVARAQAIGESVPAELADRAGLGQATQAGPLTPDQRYRRAVAGIAVTALLFALVHLSVPQSVPAIFLLALAMGYAYERTGSIVTPIVMHLLFNAFNVAMHVIELLTGGGPGLAWSIRG